MTSKTIEKILSKKKVIFLFLLFLVILPFTYAEILSGNTERDCLNNKCIYSVTQSDRFLNYGGKWLYFNQFATLNTVGNDLIYSTPISTSATNTNVNLSIWVTYNEVDMALSSLTGTQIISFNPEYVLSKSRDEYKFNLSFVKSKEITRVGFKINSNRPFTYSTLSSSTGLAFDNIVSNNMELSLQDLIDSGYSVTLDKLTGIYWIDISKMFGAITLDPVSTFYSLSTDGVVTFDEATNTCQSGGSSGTTYDLGHPVITPLVRNAEMLEFNTSTIAVDQQIDYANLSLYVGQYASTCAIASPDFAYIIKGGTFDTVMNCSDEFSTTGTNDGFLSWGTTTGWKVKDITPSLINRTQSTLIEVVPNWARYTCSDGQSKYWRTRQSEFTGTTYDPILTVVTSTIVTTPTLTNNPIIEKHKYPLLLILAVIFVILISQTKKGEEK